MAHAPLSLHRLKRCFNIEDLRAAAKSRLPKGLFEYIDRGAEDEITMQANRLAFQSLLFKTRFMVNLNELKTETTLFGKSLSFPLIVAPTGVAGVCWYEGERALASAAKNAGIPFCLANGSVTAMERITKPAAGAWFQLYMWQEMELSYHMVDRAKAAGFEALILTIDGGLGNNREYNRRNGFTFPFKINPRILRDMALNPSWLIRVIGRYLVTSGMPRHENFPGKYAHRINSPSNVKPKRNRSLTWNDVSELKRYWDGPLIIKGILNSEDALQAVEAGADAIIVSNHGGRELDSAATALEMLPEIAAAVKGKTTVLMDSGVRRGGDIVKALALGADAVLAGRAGLYGLSVAGEAGAEHAFNILHDEFRKTMASVGCLNVRDINPTIFSKASLRRMGISIPDETTTKGTSK